MANNPTLCVEKAGFIEPVLVQEKPPGVDLTVRKETQIIINESQIPIEERLEKRAETLAEKLLDDAEEVLKDPDETRYDKQGNEYFDTTSRRKYALSVVNVVAKMVQGKQAVKLKKGEEARNNASFLMDLLKKAQSGTMDLAQLDSLKVKNE